MNRVLVCGAGGFIGSHLVRRLKRDGHWVRGVDQKLPEFAESDADEFLTLDLRERSSCMAALDVVGGMDEVYQLAADMGGMGFIHSAESAIMHNSALININMIDSAAAVGISRYFFSSSVCVYRDMVQGERELNEEDAYPALPDNEYGWEKLYTERMLQVYGRRFDMAVRIARFENCYGPEGTWQGGREKAPAAICRKVAEAFDGQVVEVWGDGTAVRCYTYVDDMVDGVVRLMGSNRDGPVNIGSPEYVTVKDLVETVRDVAGKDFEVRWIDGPVGVRSRNFSHARIGSLGWKAMYSLKDGIALTYPWVEKQVRNARTTR